MAVPEFQSFMLPVLQLFSDNNIHTTNECMKAAIDCFKLDENDIKLTVPSGKQTLVANRVYWSLTYLKKSMLLETKPNRIDKKMLSQYEEYRVFSNQENDTNIVNNDKVEEITPEEDIDKIYKNITEQLADDLLEIISDKDPYYFERLVMDVLAKMGYGNFDDNSNTVTKKSGDEGIDGIINQDKLGLDKIYIQAKRWRDNVGRPQLQNFVGALSAKNSSKGIFITTSDFTKEAKDYATNLSHTIILINGKQLAKLMIEYNVGVQINYSYDIKKIDNDYFEMI